MSSLLEQLSTANGEVARLTGLLTEFNTLRPQLEQIPGGIAGLATLVTEHGQFRADVDRLTGENSAATTENARLTGEITRLTGELETARAAMPAQEQVEQRAAEIHASTGVPPAAAETASAAAASGEPANSESFFAEYDRLHAENPAAAGAYWQRWNRKF